MKEALTGLRSEYVIPVPTVCVVVTWADLRPGDELWYFIARAGRFDPDSPYGPFTVVDPAQGRIRNSSGVELNFLTSKLVLLRPKNAPRRPPCSEPSATCSADGPTASSSSGAQPPRS